MNYRCERERERERERAYPLMSIGPCTRILGSVEQSSYSLEYFYNYLLYNWCHDFQSERKRVRWMPTLVLKSISLWLEYFHCHQMVILLRHVYWDLNSKGERKKRADQLELCNRSRWTFSSTANVGHEIRKAWMKFLQRINCCKCFCFLPLFVPPADTAPVL